MTTLRKNLLVAVAAVGLAGAAVAQSTAPTGAATGGHAHAESAEQHAAKRAERQAKRAARQAERAAKLRAELKLDARQEAAFAAYLESGKPAQRAQGRMPGERAHFAALPAPQRMERMIERQKQRTARMETRLAALNNLYAVLTPEQRQVFDKQALRGFGGKDRGHHGRQHGHHGAPVQG